MSQPIYFDESGFTGNDLLSKDQPYFVYAGVAIDSHRAQGLVTEAISKFCLDGSELKGKKLTRHPGGQRAVSWILRELGEDVRVAAFDKQYALAWKFFDYIFEPVLAAQNSIFYRAEFNYFIAMLLYLEMNTADKSSRIVIEEFQQFMRTYNVQHLDNVLATIDVVAPDRPLWKILAFAILHRNKIKCEVQEIRRIGGPLKWILDLTAGSLYGILSYWGERFEDMEVFCDESKPLKAYQNFFNSMIGQKEKIYHPLYEKQSLVFNLSSPIFFVDSSSYHGVQIADIVASALTFALKNVKNSTSKEWIEILSEKFVNATLLPVGDDINLKKEKPFINSLILEEFIRRYLRNSGTLSIV